MEHLQQIQHEIQVQNETIIQCVKIGSKLRMRIKTSNIPLNKNINCSGCKTIRKEGVILKYKGNIKLMNVKNTLYYKLSNNIGDYQHIADSSNEVQETDLTKLNIQIFKEQDCCICFTSNPNIIFLPCGHQIVCNQCWDSMKSIHKKCPFCRVSVNSCIQTSHYLL